MTAESSRTSRRVIDVKTILFPEKHAASSATSPETPIPYHGWATPPSIQYGKNVRLPFPKNKYAMQHPNYIPLSRKHAEIIPLI